MSHSVTVAAAGALGNESVCLDLFDTHVSVGGCDL